ncbi:MAG: hypothetical protein ACTHN5_00135 [Phycisphaerae bacterium]
MLQYRSATPRALVAMALTLSLARAGFAAAAFRVATYNLDSDTPDFSGVNQQTYLETVLEGINSYHLNDSGTPAARNIDLLAVQELQNGSGGTYGDTLSSIVTNLNATYGAGTYAADATYDPTTGNTTGNGPSGLVYNARTLQVVSAAPLGTASGSGAARAPMEYQMHPIGFSNAANFYVIVSHMKSGTAGSDVSRRNAEATVIVNAINALPANSHVIVLGDLNITNGSAESTYQTLLTKLDDVAHPSGSWGDSNTTAAKAISGLLSESATYISYRDDMQLVTPAADPASGAAQNGLQYISGSSLVFGNGGATTIVGHAVTDTVHNSNALSDLPLAQRTNVLNALTNATDHLPVIADYSLVGLNPVAQSVAWISGRAGTWSTSADWSPATVPENAGTLSYAASISSGNATLNVDITIHSLTMTGGTLAGAANLTLTSGTINGAYNVTGATTITSDPITATPAGTLTFNGGVHGAGAFTGAGNLTINAGASLTADAVTLNMLTVNGNLVVRADGTIAGTSKINALALAGAPGNWSGALDLADNKLIIEDAATHAQTFLTLQDQVVFGLTHPAGIFSSDLPAGTALAVLDNAILHKTTFGGLSVDDNALLVAPELLGDANADGAVDLTDLSTVLNNFGQSNSAWTDGNFDRAPTINLTDLSDVLNNFGASFPNASARLAAVTAVPEPASLIFAAGGLLALIPKRRRLHR